MIPSRRLLILLLLWLLVGLVGVWLPAMLVPWKVLAVLLVVSVNADIWRLRRIPSPTAERTGPSSLAIGHWHTITLRLSNPGSRPVSAHIFDLHPADFEVRDLPRSLVVPAGAWQEVAYTLRPMSRGRFAYGGVDAWISGPLGLFSQRRLLPADGDIKVFPDFRQITRYALLAMQERTASMGIHLQRRRGQGQEFHQLREYRDGDSMRQVDWRAVSRRNQLISREYREEQNQRVVFLLDCGRRMRADEGPDAINHFDMALNAVLLLSYVALRQGDSVGLLAFAGADRWLPPVRGRGGINAVLSSVFDLQTTTAPSDYATAATTLAARQRRRALIVLVTNLRDDDASDLPLALAPLRRRHLVLTASMREPALLAAAREPVSDLADALRAASAAHYLQQRTAAHAALRRKRLMTIDVEPANLPITLVNRYLEIKRAGML